MPPRDQALFVVAAPFNDGMSLALVQAIRPEVLPMQFARRCDDDFVQPVLVNCCHGTKRSMAGVRMGSAQSRRKAVAVKLRQAARAVPIPRGLRRENQFGFLDVHGQAALLSGSN